MSTSIPSVSCIERLCEEMRAYYLPLRTSWLLRNGETIPPLPEHLRAARERIRTELEAHVAAYPGEHPSLLKAAQMEIMARHAEPVIFPHSPFFFEMGLRPAENWGAPSYDNGTGHLGAWMFERQIRAEGIWGSPEWHALGALSQGYGQSVDGTPRNRLYWLANGYGFDSDHHCPGYTLILREGFLGILARIARRQSDTTAPAEAAELDAMERGIRALLTVAERFAETAEQQLATATDPVVRKNLMRIAEAARQVPARPPRTFHEGLASLWFVREAMATLEAVGISVIGHPDRQLIDLYRADIAAGRLTENEARELVALWMAPTDVKTFTRERDWPETSTCLMLGGCDEHGAVVFNELTRLFLRTHWEEGLINPKLNCRVDAEAPREYLDLMGEMLAAGHNRFAFLSDDVLIPAARRHGKTDAEARLYVAGGCQETMCEGVEHTAGAFFYYNMPAVFSDWFRTPDDTSDMPALALEALPPAFGSAPTFEALYAACIEALSVPMRAGLRWMKALGERHWNINPCPLFSATLAGCTETATDYTRGGAKYNPSGVCFIGFGNIVNMLHAIRTGVYEEQWTSLDELRAAMRANWSGHEPLRRRLTALAVYGHGHAGADALAARVAKDLADACRACPNERGGYFQANFFVYRSFKSMGHNTRATPDGRRDGDMLCQGIAPDRRNAPKSLTDVFRTLQAIDFRDYPGNAILDAMLPAGNRVPVSALSATIRTFARMGGPTLQLNCVDAATLKDAQVNPDRHRDLVVRVSGLSVCFVRLTRDMQDEFIGRAMFETKE